MAGRLLTLEAGVQDRRLEFAGRVPRKVPMEWMGVANEVGAEAPCCGDACARQGGGEGL
jgi:hypothetical protein